MSFCTTMGSNKIKINKESLLVQNENLAKEAYRVIAIADGLIEEKDKYSEKDIKNLNFVGLVAFIDPVREGVKESINDAKKAGIKVIMITGDHPLTAFAIGKELGIANTIDDVADGYEIKKYLEMGSVAFDNFIKQKKVFSRVSPIDKLEIVNSLKRQGEFVAVTGDGVNDAPAIKSANIGIAMGSGTDVAKETAKMIITNDNFISIVSGIKEGRTAYNNIRKIIYMLISCGIAEVLFFTLSIAFNMPVPLLAIQLLWLNIVTDGLQDLALSLEPAEKKVMKEKPRSPKEALFNKTLFEEILISGLFIGLLVFLCWYYLLNKLNMDPIFARGYIMTLMVFIQNVHVLNCRSESESIFKVPINNPFLLLSVLTTIFLQIIIMTHQGLSKFLKINAISFKELLYLLLLSSTVLIIMEIYKKIKKPRK